MSSLSPVSILVILLSACGGTSPPAVDPKPETGPVAAPTVAPNASDPTEPESVPPASSGKVASTWKIEGTDLSSVDVPTVKAALEKTGYATIGPEDIVTCGEIETLQLSVTRNAKPVGLVIIKRPAAKPDDCKAAPLKEDFAKWKASAEAPGAKNAIRFDEPANVLIAINLMKDAPGAAKKLLDALVKE
jgi:hypothetical protein